MNTLRLIQVRLITELFNAVGGLLFSLLTLSKIVSYMKKYTAIDYIGIICFQGLDLDLGPHLAITGHQIFTEYILLPCIVLYLEHGFLGTLGSKGLLYKQG